VIKLLLTRFLIRCIAAEISPEPPLYSRQTYRSDSDNEMFTQKLDSDGHDLQKSTLFKADSELSVPP
jgi:hypothetical protein